MKQQVVYVMTHDSIGVGEDGPTHQPIEHLASLRAIPNLYVFRPADAIETLECINIALEKKNLHRYLHFQGKILITCTLILTNWPTYQNLVHIYYANIQETRSDDICYRI